MLRIIHSPARWVAFAVALLGLVPGAARAADPAPAELRYAVLDVATLFNESRVFPGPGFSQSSRWSQYPFAHQVEVDGGEAFIGIRNRDNATTPTLGAYDFSRIVVAVPVGSTPVLRAVIQAGESPAEWREAPWSDGAVISAAGDPKDEFLLARASFYAQLWKANIPGGAHFRHEYRMTVADMDNEVHREAARRQYERPDWRGNRARDTELDRSYALFSGGRALQENLQLDVVLQTSDEPAPKTVPLDSVVGVTVKEIDWAPLLEGASPAKDPLADWVPHDNLAAFFPSFKALVAVVDEAERVGNPLAGLYSVRAENLRTRERVERQLQLPLTWAARQLGSTLIEEIAITAGDPYLREGTDIAVLLKPRQADALGAFIAGQWAAARAADSTVREASGEVAGIAWRGVANPARTVCSYSATIDGIVVVTNSAPLLGRIALARRGGEPAIAGLGEYAFFRNRYARGDAAEDALLILTDAAIRKWTSPKWRIAQSRRIRAAAAMADLAAQRRNELVEGIVEPLQETVQWRLLGGGDLVLDDGGPRHAVYGSLDFLTPISELVLDEVTEDEAAAYERFRSRYQDRWRAVFDPVAARLGVREGIDIDLSVMPLIMGSDYNEMMELTGRDPMAADAGDPHGNALLHIIWHLDPEAEPVREMESMMAPSFGAVDRPLRWIGETLELYVDDSAFHDDWMAAADSDDFMRDNWPSFPIAVRVAVRNPLALAAFLTGFRTMVDSSAPDMASWTTAKHMEKTYVKIGAQPGFVEEFAIYYLTEPEALTISLSENVIKGAIERSVARADGGGDSGWLGNSASGGIKGRGAKVLRRLMDDDITRRARTESFAALPILNEWRRLHPGRDPLEVQRAVSGSVLYCPGSQPYAWNADLRTMESPVFGSPLRTVEKPVYTLPLEDYASLAAGLTFEHDGVRVRAKAGKGTDEK